MYLCQRLGPSPASVPTAVAAFAIKLLIVTHKKKDGQIVHGEIEGITLLEVIGNVFYGCLVNFFMEELVLKALIYKAYL